jgi:hypothetical protein
MGQSLISAKLWEKLCAMFWVHKLGKYLGKIWEKTLGKTLGKKWTK